MGPYFTFCAHVGRKSVFRISLCFEVLPAIMPGRPDPGMHFSRVHTFWVYAAQFALGPVFLIVTGHLLNIRNLNASPLMPLGVPYISNL